MNVYMIQLDSPNQTCSFIQSVYTNLQQAKKELKRIRENLEQQENFYVREPMGNINSLQVNLIDEDGHINYHSFYKIIEKEVTEEC